MSEPPPNGEGKQRPYYDREAAARRRAARLAKLKQAWGFGTAIVKRPSDATMDMIKKAR